MHLYRTHTCGELRDEHIGQTVRLSGWIHRKRDHGNLLFIDLRDQYGLTQCVVETDAEAFKGVEEARLESVITATGNIVARSAETINAKLPTGQIELSIKGFQVESPAEILPMQIAGNQISGEETRLRYRFLDLRREQMQKNIRLRSAVISSIRERMIEQGFM